MKKLDEDYFLLLILFETSFLLRYPTHSILTKASDQLWFGIYLVFNTRYIEYYILITKYKEWIINNIIQRENKSKTIHTYDVINRILMNNLVMVKPKLFFHHNITYDIT